ncbi:MAG: DUF1080 domain-containing protein [Bacteroidetes bacterium]|nr:DUF1080 domain-containing protein [Fibrella sp.]
MQRTQLARTTLLALAFTASLTLTARPGVARSESGPNDPPASSNKGKWTTLFDGKNFTGWHIYNKPGQPISAPWVIQDGAMYLGQKSKDGPAGGDVVSDKEYGNFELEIEWKISEGGNSGIMYHVNEDPKFRAPYYTGPEVQVLDNDRHPDAKAGRDGNRTAGCLYDMLPPGDRTAVKPVGDWNKVRLVVDKGRAQQYLNGKLMADYPTSGPEWDKLVAESKFKSWASFGKFTTGRIALQDHGNPVWFRNIRIREL